MVLKINMRKHQRQLRKMGLTLHHIDPNQGHFIVVYGTIVCFTEMIDHSRGTLENKKCRQKDNIASELFGSIC